nr:E3 ubiquitin-protein ligase MARCHF2 isoform X1 [Chrysemys picta bellii]XP_042697321.1 E3 ubiquitin-protein ligase MARCHF2 isoform X1 [Chrysemys picta bellii]
MTTGDCCHLPGSLCDCPGSAALSKSVEDSDIGQPQYVTQVTAKDGRLLSTVIKALGAQSDGPICRICHEGGNGEGLLSPCDCTGTLGTVHKSCLEKWLSSSNTSYCELCHTEFVVERRPRPLTEWLKDPGPRNEKRTLFCDMVCFLFITPLAAISGWLCLRGAQDHLQFNSRLEAIGLIALTIALFTIYVLWTLSSVVQVLTDNAASMFCVNIQRGSKEALRLWDFCIQHTIHLEASNLPGVRNTLVDRLSRSFFSHYEWSLHSEVSQMLFQRWGAPQVDLFASRQYKCHQFCSLQGLDSSSLSGAFLLSWSEGLMYGFPPDLLISRVLSKIKRDQA